MTLDLEVSSNDISENYMATPSSASLLMHFKLINCRSTITFIHEY